ncbi:MAG: hypothetical protein AB7O65_14375 [Candidatus Korobacteraceae bacterium]
MVAEYPERIWFYPPKFWAVTRKMSQDQVDDLMNRIWRMAEQRDLQGLSEFDFIYVGNPYLDGRSKAS